MVASRSDPFAFWGRARVPPANPPPKSCSNIFAWEPSDSKKGLKPPPPNPGKPPPNGFRPNASGSNPGCWDADPYWSYAARFLSSLRIYHRGCARFSRTKQKFVIDRYTYFVCFLYLLKFFPRVFVWICIRMKFTSELSGVSEASARVNLAAVMPDVRRNKFSLSRLQSHPFSHPELDMGPPALTRVMMHESVASCQQPCFRVSGGRREKHVKRKCVLWGIGRNL